MACDLTTIQASACISGIGKITDPVLLMQLIAQLTCEASQGGGSGGVAWGSITGTLSNQTDLQTALDAKANVSTTKVYRAILTQAGTAPPAATVLENSLGGTVVWTYNIVGQYTGTLAGAFPANKTAISCGSSWAQTIVLATPSAISIQTTRVSANAINLRTSAESPVDGAAEYEDDILSETLIEILVYP